MAFIFLSHIFLLNQLKSHYTNRKMRDRKMSGEKRRQSTLNWDGGEPVIATRQIG